MPERDCSNHTWRVVVTLNKELLEKKQHSNLIAALLRQIADYTDGWCSTEYAKDADLDGSGGITFYFTEGAKQTKFIDRIGYYLRNDIAAALTVKKA
jgi:hypothetical protein